MSYIGKYFSPRMFFFPAESDEAHEKRSAAICSHGPTRNLVQELCYRYDLKILGMSEKFVSLCTSSGLVPMRVARHYDEYAVHSLYIQKERGDNRNRRAYKSLRPLMNAIKDEIPADIIEAELFDKLYRGCVNAQSSFIKDWFDSEDSRKETRLIKMNRWEPIMNMDECMEVIEAIFESKASQIKEHPKYLDMYNKIRLHRAGTVMKDDLLKKMAAGSKFIVMQKAGPQVITADLKFRWDTSVDEYRMAEVTNIRRVRAMNEIPDVAGHYAMLKTAYPEKMNDSSPYRWDHFFLDFETSTFKWNVSNSYRPEENAVINGRPTMLMITGGANESV